MKPWYRLIPWLAVLVVLSDGWLKAFALEHFPIDTTLHRAEWIMLAVHRNPGIAFDIPLKLQVILTISFVLGVVLTHVAWKNRILNPPLTYASLLVIIGGIGNVYDRVVYGFTVDYILLFGRSAINLSDAVILLGILWLLLASRPKPLVTERVH